MKKQTIAVIGFGQHGRSIADRLSMLLNHYNFRIYDKNPGIRREAERILGERQNVFIADNPIDAVKHSSIVLLATPVDQFGPIVQEIQNHLKPGMIVTDIGSVKTGVIEEVQKHLPEGVEFVSTHPVAGAPGSGPTTGHAKMYDGRPVVFVGDIHEEIVDMWRHMNAYIRVMDPAQHDHFYAVASQFVHVVAFAMALAGEKTENEIFYEYNFAGNSLVDITCLSRAAAETWAPIFIANKDNIMKAASSFRSHMQTIKDLHDRPTAQELEDFFRAAHLYRDGAMSHIRPREHLCGEIRDLTDWLRIEGIDCRDVLSLTKKFDQAAMISLGRRTCLPAMLSAVLTRNTKQSSEEDNVTIASFVPQSFRNASAAILSEPEYISALLFASKNHMAPSLSAFEKHLKNFLKAIKDENRPELERLIRKANAIQSKMPRISTTPRDEFALPHARPGL